MNKKKTRNTKSDKRDPLLEVFYAHKNQRSAILLLKTERSYAQAKAILPKLGWMSISRDLRNTIIGTLKSSSWDEVATPSVLPPSKDWLQELGWLTHGFRAEAKFLNSFIESRRQFGRAYLLGDFATAKHILEEISHNHGISFWHAEKEFMLLQSSEGFNSHLNKLSEILANVKNLFIRYVIKVYSYRLEPSVTPKDFERTSNQVSRNLRADKNEEFASWVELHVTPWKFEWLKDRHYLLHKCCGKTLIDRYDRVMKIMSCIVLDGLASDERSLLCAIIEDLNAVIKDQQIQHLITLLNPTRRSIQLKTDLYLRALDDLIVGNFSNAITETLNLLNEDPTCFEFYWLLARALTYGGRSIPPILSEKSLARSILENLLPIAQNCSDIQMSLAALEICALKLGDNHLGISLWQFAKHEEFERNDMYAANQILLQDKIDAFALMRNCSEFHSNEDLEAIKKSYGKHISVQLWLYGKTTLFNEQIDNKVAPLFASIARAKRFALQNMHNKVLEELTPLLDVSNKSKLDVRLLGKCVAQLEFEAQLGLGRVENAANSIIKHYTENPNNLRFVPYQKLIEGCVSGKWPGLRKLPCWPILVLLNHGSEQDIYEAVDDMLLEHRCDSPKAIIDGLIECDNNVLRILLRDVLIPKVISRGALWNRSAEERRNMRKQLLQKLYGISVSDQAFVLDELSQLEQAQLLETAYKEIEGPKFDLNFSSANRELANIYDSIFSRYNEYRSYEVKRGLILDDPNEENATDQELLLEKLHENSDLMLTEIIFSVFIYYILDNNSGINATLGTRIRHGSLENQLTRVFGAHSLLALKNTAGMFVCEKSIIERIRYSNQDVQTAILQA